MTIDTACSSSMLALHGAVQSLRSGESQVAVAAGGNLILGPELFIALSKVNMLSTKGRSAMWDADVDGYGRGEGFVGVVMKRLSDAIKDGDHIDCVIREAATNQDGRTKGITMPSATAQAQLIRRAYADVGLDLRNVEDRPQFFEAHGTGTKAGDPQEAEAIHTAFFGSGLDCPKQDNPLYVGGIKTVVGHTEGTAGLAGLLKASLALQAKEIPPNLLFNTLNPELAPFYGPLEVPTKALPWPDLPEGVPRRASVNSFGFGGANTHIILESAPDAESSPSRLQADVLTPFVFSASSESALQRLLSSYREYLDNHPDINLLDLAWTLAVRRSTLPVKVALSASTLGELVEAIDEKLQYVEKTPGSTVGIRSVTGNHAILGVFTGQGAQWPRMGKKLVDTVPRAREIVDELDQALQDLPDSYRPTWHILEELSREGSSSRMQEAAFSQPLCTVVQVILVELLRATGIRFSAVVGHSSGEIGAAYAAGFLTAGDAIKIAYLRGFCAPLARGPNGEKGAMMAVGTSAEEAEQLCALPELKGRIKLAASNSSSSLTLSGDADAVSRAKAILDEQKVFARLLKVDTAYHSHHMQPCAEPYLEALHAAGVTIQSPADGCIWYSSVLNGSKVEASEVLRGTYWRDNMVNTVLFSQAIESAVKNCAPFHMALEVGPHPALKGPATQTLAELGTELPYAGVLKRGESDVESFSDCLGAVWANLGSSAVNVEAVQGLLPGNGTPRLLKNLPSYAWDHDKPYWYESRKSKAYRTRSQVPHELLGTRYDDGCENELRWRNFLSVQELPWLEGHQIQGQVVFPAAGYVSMVLEAAQIMVDGNSIEVIEIESLVIGRAIVLHDEKTGVETTTTLSSVRTQGKLTTAEFTISAHISRDTTSLTKVASGTVSVTLGDSGSSPSILPVRRPAPAHLIDVDTGRFYSALEKTGYNYTGNFRAFTDMKRRLNFTTGYVKSPPNEDGRNTLLVHPGMLDHAFQALFGTYCWPGDGRLWTLFLPTSIRKVTVNPSQCRQGRPSGGSDETKFAFDAWLLDSPPQEMRGDVVFSLPDGAEQAAVVQVEGASMSTLGEATPREDRHMFFETIWGAAAPDGAAAVGVERATDEEWEVAEACERSSQAFAGCCLPSSWAAHGRKNSYLKPEWREDDEQVISEMIDRYPTSVDIRLAANVGRALPSVIRGETTMLEHMRPNGMLDEFYGDSLGLPASNLWLGRMVKQLTHRYPRMSFVEIGAGTGSSTQAILEAIGGNYSGYTFTDISSGFFERAADRFASAGDKMTFKTLDVEKPIADQGYTPNSYDVVVASNVLHATTSLHNTLQNVRSLLKPGGYLFLLEITDNTTIRYSFTMGGLPGWWMGVEDGRPYSPCIAPSKWNQALRKAGFAGVDAVTPARDLHPNPFSVIAAQAVDGRTDQLRKPLLKVPQHQDFKELYVLGGQGLETSDIIDDVTETLGHVFDHVVTVDSLLDLLTSDLSENAIVLSLLDLDGPVFKDLSAEGLRALQMLTERARNMLWVTQAQSQENPWSNAVVGFLRSVSAELPTLRAQVLDFDVTEKAQRHSRVISEALLRLLVSDEWERDPEFKNQQLWTTEPELRFYQGKFWVPRVVGHRRNNDRLNVRRRVIKQEADGDALVQLSRVDEGGPWALTERYEPKIMPSATASDTVAVRVKYSTLWAPKLGSHGRSTVLLIIGQLVENGQWVLSATAERCSVVHVDRTWIAALPAEVNERLAELIADLSVEVLSVRIADLASETGGLVLVHEPEPLLAAVLRRKALAMGFRVKFSTGNPRNQEDDDWIYVHPRELVQVTQQALPKDPVAFVYPASPESRHAVDLIAACLPSSCRVAGLEGLCLSREPTPLPAAQEQGVGVYLNALLSEARADVLASGYEPARDFANTYTVSLNELQQTAEHASPFTLIDWQAGVQLLLEVSPPQPETLFKPDRSYMLVGMTGEMGQSLCRWMAQNGAGAVIMTSRNPKIDQAWVDELEAAGSRIKIAGFDATSREAWVRFASDIKSDLPPLAGIINGAVVLQDQLFLDMDIDVFNKTLAPKIDSTIHLDEVFRDDPLDFFLVFSSLSSIIGNRGQANYNAANAFMTSLVRQRRARRQAASVLHLGSVVGVGYLTRAGDVMETILTKYGYLPVSEVDLHHLVSQCIMAGIPNSGENPDLITGLRYAREDEVAGLHWATNPRFSHMVLPPETESVGQGEKKVVLSTRAQLAAATTEQEACKALEACFGAKLMAILQIAESSFRPEAALIELGVDSLVAVEIRSWFVKELTVDVAVLKILGGASTISLCQYAIEQVPRELLPGIGSEAVADGDASAADAPAEVKKPSESIVPEIVKDAKGSDKDLIQPMGQAASSVESSNTPVSSAASNPSADSPSPASSVVNDEIKVAPRILRRVRMSSSQSRFWFLNMFLEDKTASNITFSYNIRGRINIAALSRAVKSTANAHQALRTCFLADEESSEKAWQGLMVESKLQLEHQTVSTDEDVAQVYERVRHTAYDLSQGDTIQIVLLSKDAMNHTIIFGYHHIVLDGIGFESFLADLEQVVAGHQPSPQGLQYPEYSEKEGREIERGGLEGNMGYWCREFQDMPPLLPILPVSKITSRQPVTRYASSYVEHRLDSQLAAKIKTTCRQSHVTPSHFYLATFRVMLLRLAGVEELCIGVADANRHDNDVVSTVGLFLNMLPIRFDKITEEAFSDVLRHTRAKVWEGLSHAGVPFDEVLRALQVPRSSTHSPLFQAFFDYHQGAQEKRKFGNTTWENADRHPGERAYDITLDVIEGTAGSLVALIGQEYLYGAAEMEKLLDCYVTLLEEFANSPSTKIKEAGLYSRKQIDAALDLGRGPRVTLEWNSTLGHRVYEMAQRFPDEVALKDGRGVLDLTYRDLERRAGAIRDNLVAAGVKRGDRVAVFQEPTPDWIVSIIAIFWSGAVYVPLVLLNPMPRLAAIVQAAEPKAILAHDSTIEMAPELRSENGVIIDVSQVPVNGSGSITMSSIPVSGEDSAVILFTSGSTGVPKGIVLRHRNLMHHIEGYTKAWNIGREFVLQQSAFSFDLSIGQIFTALAMGGTLVVAPEDVRRDPAALATLIRREKITWTLLTPSEYSGVLQAGAEDLRQASSWEHALACGEALTPKLVREFAKLGHEGVRLYNAYGPAEAIISATMAEILFRDDGKDEVSVTAGTPNPNYSIYIVDDHGNPLPQGFPGEIWIGGCGVAVGYLNDESLTRDKFLTDKFESAADRQQGWNVTYRTGDMGRLEEDGSLTYEGRREGDSQVKIRGFRVDLLDIESTILTSAEGILSDAVVTMRAESQSLVAHVIFARDQQAVREDQAEYLAELLSSLPLPKYMQPTMAVPVDDFPKNLHGKKDRSAIAKLVLPQGPSSEPRSDRGTGEKLTAVEERLAAAWREVLPAEFVSLFSVGASTDFFAVGGNSLLLVKLQGRIREAFEVSLPLLQLLDAGTLRNMASKIEASRVVETVDWDKETALDQDLAELVAASGTETSQAKKHAKVVLMTGATGYLGPYLLRELIEDATVQTVHCVAVRGEDHAHAKSRLPSSLLDSNKLVIHVGDMSAPRLGLEQDVADSLVRSVDLIVHSGAKRSFWDSYYELSGPNVTSTTELLRLAAPRRVPIHFLSSSGVLLLNDNSAQGYETAARRPAASVASSRPPSDGSEGYVASKWASEMILEKASRELGVPVTIHRFTPRTAQGSDEGVEEAALGDLLAPTTRLGAIPERSTWAGRFDVVRAPRLAGQILSSSPGAEGDGEGEEARHVHHQGEAGLGPEQLFDFLEGNLGATVPGRLGLLEWVGAIKKEGYGWLFSTHDLALTTTEHGVTTTLVNRR